MHGGRYSINSSWFDQFITLSTKLMVRELLSLDTHNIIEIIKEVHQKKNKKKKARSI